MNQADSLFYKALDFVMRCEALSLGVIMQQFNIPYRQAFQLAKQIDNFLPYDIPIVNAIDIDVEKFANHDNQNDHQEDVNEDILVLPMIYQSLSNTYQHQATGCYVVHYHLTNGMIDHQYPIDLRYFPLGNKVSAQDIFDAEIIHHVVMREFTHAKEDFISFDSEDLEVHFLGHHQFIQLTLIAHADTFLQDLRTLWQSQLLAQINQYRNHHAIEQYFAILIGDDDLELEVYEFIGELLKAPALTSSDGIMKIGIRFTDSNDHSSDQMTHCVISLRLRNEDDAI